MKNSRSSNWTIECKEFIEKSVNKSGKNGRVYVPAEWIGKKVRIVLEDDDE